MRSWTRSRSWLLAAIVVATCTLASASVTSAADAPSGPTILGKPLKDVDWYRAGKNANRFLRTTIHAYDVYRRHNPRYRGPAYGGGWHGGGYAPGHMGGYAPGYMGGYGPGYMGGYAPATWAATPPAIWAVMAPAIWAVTAPAIWAATAPAFTSRETVVPRAAVSEETSPSTDGLVEPGLWSRPILRLRPPRGIE
jgi:hypothetical protein